MTTSTTSDADATSSRISVDHESLLVRVEGRVSLHDLERTLGARGLTLGLLEIPEMTVDDWLSHGAPGAPSSFFDPTDHLLAGLEATLTNGTPLVVHPSPRRAVGPDLTALFVSGGHRFGRVRHAWLRVHRKDADRVRHPLPAWDLDPPMSPRENALVDAIAAELSRSAPPRK